jgi:hypothetical protein
VTPVIMDLLEEHIRWAGLYVLSMKLSNIELAHFIPIISVTISPPKKMRDWDRAPYLLMCQLRARFPNVEFRSLLGEFTVKARDLQSMTLDWCILLARRLVKHAKVLGKGASGTGSVSQSSLGLSDSAFHSFQKFSVC